MFVMESKSCVVAQTDPTRYNVSTGRIVVKRYPQIGFIEPHENHLLKVVAYPPIYLLSGPETICCMQFLSYDKCLRMLFVAQYIHRTKSLDHA